MLIPELLAIIGARFPPPEPPSPIDLHLLVSDASSDNAALTAAPPVFLEASYDILALADLYLLLNLMGVALLDCRFL